jgi:hypothetical protein
MCVAAIARVGFANDCDNESEAEIEVKEENQGCVLVGDPPILVCSPQVPEED